MRRILSVLIAALIVATVVMVMTGAALAREPFICHSANLNWPPQADAAIATHAMPHACQPR